MWYLARLLIKPYLIRQPLIINGLEKKEKRYKRKKEVIEKNKFWQRGKWSSKLFCENKTLTLNYYLNINPFLYIFCFQTTYPIQLKFPNVIWNFLMWSESSDLTSDNSVLSSWIVRPDLGQFSFVLLNHPSWRFCELVQQPITVLL